MPVKYRKLRALNNKLRRTLKQISLTHKVQNCESPEQGFQRKLENHVSFVLVAKSLGFALTNYRMYSKLFLF